MQFLAPIAFAAFAALPVIVVFHMLKLRRDRHVVSSTLLWRKSVDDLQANAPFQRLRANLLLLLQLLMAAAMAFALTRPLMQLTGRQGRSRAILMDVSASMATREREGPRLDLARRLARRLVDEMLPGDEAMLIAFATSAEVLTTFTSDKSRLKAALDDLEVRALPSDATDALSLAASLTRNRPSPEIVVVSDGRFPTPDAVDVGEAPVELVVVGEDRPNVGVTAVDARRDLGGRRETQVFVVTRNFGSAPAEVEMDLLRAGALVDTRRLTIAPDAERSTLFLDAPDGANADTPSERLEIRLRADDSLSLDDTAFCVLRPPARAKVTLVTVANPFLTRALRQNPNVEFQVAPPSGVAPPGEADLVIFDGAAPAEVSPGAYWFLNCAPPFEGFAVEGRDEAPEIFDWRADHPLLRFVQFQGVLLAESLRMAMPRECETLVESREGPLMALYVSQGRRCLVQTFDLYNSNLPYRVAFPVLVANILEWARRGSAARRGVTLAAGEPIESAPQDAGERLTMRTPGGDEWRVERDGQGRVVFDKTWDVGYYTLMDGGEIVDEFGVSLLNAEESDVAPRTSLNVGDRPARTSAALSRKTNREIWPWFVWAALALILIEWIIYHRRIFV